MTTNERKARWRDLMQSEREGMTSCALVLARRFLADFPKSGTAWLGYAGSLYSVARYPEALAALRRAARLFPADKLHYVQNHFGHLYQQRGHFRRAESWFRKAILSCPSHASAYIYLGSLLALEGRFSEAEEVHRQAALCEDGCIEEAYLNVGLVLRAQERYAEALAYFRRALKINPKYKLAQKKISDVERVLKLTRGNQDNS